jgi:small subunit ribosomal protein S4e
MKRHEIPKNWPIPTKGNKYIVKPKFSNDKGMPILVLMRDMLGIAQNRKEVRRAIYLNKILINGRQARDERNTLVLFDTLSILPMKKHYRLIINEKGKFSLEEISEKDSVRKVSKIRDKRVLKGKKKQINLNDGRNFLSDVESKVGDSVLVNLKDKKIEKVIPLKEKSNVWVFAGKHAGKIGRVEGINEKLKMAEVETKNKDKINVLIKQLMAIE